MGFIIAICHQKGGVAKTTTTLGLGASFAERGIETLLVDLDPQANLTSNLGSMSTAGALTIAEVLTEACAPDQAALESGVPGLDIIPSGASMLDLNRRLPRMEGYEFLLRRALSKIEPGRYAVALLDCPPSVSPITLNALTAADLLIIPTQCEYFSIQALAEMIELVSVVRDRTNPALAYRLLVTMFDKRGKFHQRMLEQLREYFGGGLLDTIIGFDTKLREAQAAGCPITVLAPQSRGAGQYRRLAEELFSYVTTQPNLQAA